MPVNQLAKVRTTDVNSLALAEFVTGPGSHELQTSQSCTIITQFVGGGQPRRIYGSGLGPRLYLTRVANLPRLTVLVSALGDGVLGSMASKTWRGVSCFEPVGGRSLRRRSQLHSYFACG